MGCFRYKGHDYFFVGGPRPTAAQQLAIQKCVTSLGYTWLTAVAGGPFGFTIGGVAIALWGCS